MLNKLFYKYSGVITALAYYAFRWLLGVRAVMTPSYSLCVFSIFYRATKYKKSATDEDTFIVGFRPHIGNDKWT